MKQILFLGFSLLFTSVLQAEQFQVFEREGRFGIKDAAGEILIPAVYEKLGWSNNETEVFNEVIGFEENSRWGLLSIKNKILAENSYHSLEPFGQDHLKASVKGQSNNQLFYGLLELDGDVKVSFDYSKLDPVNNQIRAAVFDHNITKVGLLSFRNEKLIPIEFKLITSMDQWLVGEDFLQNKFVFDGKGKVIVSNIDSVRQLANGLVCYNHGLSSYVNGKNKLEYGFEYKGFSDKKGGVDPVKFETWEIYASTGLVHQWVCDSLAQKNGFWVKYLNGAEHIMLGGDDIKEFELLDVARDQLVIKHTVSKKCAVINAEGKTVFEGYDHIISSGQFYFARKAKTWDLFNRFGSKVNKYGLEEIKRGVTNYFIAKRNGYWGILDLKGDPFLEFKYDAINLEAEDLYTVQFFNKWGIMNKYGNWMINPNFQSLEVYDRLAIGTRGALRSFFLDGALFANLTYSIVNVIDGVPILEESGKYGLVSPSNSMLYRPTFDTVIVKGDIMHFYKDSSTMLIHKDGIMKVAFEEGYQKFGEYGYGHVPVMKNGKWGFVDRQSRLRIANRYDQVRPFSEGFAPIKLKGKWGFIDTKENLVVQPFYSEVSPFLGGVSIFETEAGIGMVNAYGKEVLSGWNKIVRLGTGNYLVEDKEGKIGLVDEKGNFIVRPDFTWIEDLGQQIIVKKNDKMGVLDYSGNQRIKVAYSLVKKTDNFLVAKK